jgi:cell division septation protein DedD
MPSIYKKYNEKAENEAMRHPGSVSENTVKDIAASLSTTKVTDNVDLPEASSDDIHTDESQKSTESPFIQSNDDALSLVYTVQAGSFDDLHRAGILYDSIINNLSSEDLAYLRIEKVEQYYAVRIGKFHERNDAEKFFEKIRPYLSTSFIIQAYIKEERIKKLHSS